MRGALSIGSVSVSGDEALCLSCLMGLDMEKIRAVPSSDRIKTFWSLIPKVSMGLIFSRVPNKLIHRVIRWAPSSFLELLPTNHWAGPQGLDDDSNAVVAESGLLADLPGYILDPTLIPPNEDMDNTFEHHLLRRDIYNTWYVLMLEGHWGQSSSSSRGPQRLGMIIAHSILSADSAARDAGSPSRPFSIRNTEPGIIVRIVESKCGMLYVKAKGLPVFQKLGEGYQRYLRVARKCARPILACKGATATASPIRARRNSGRLRKEPRQIPVARCLQKRSPASWG